MPPVSENMQAALKIAADKSISPALRAQQISALNLDPVMVADKLSKAGLPPLSDNMQAALKIAANRSISPALRAQQMAALNLGDPVTVADKLSAYIESAKMVPGK